MRVCAECKRIFAARFFSRRYSSDPAYVEHRRASVSKWKKENRNIVNVTAREWRINNPDKIKEYNSRFYKNNKDKVRKNSKKWRENNRDKAIASVKKWAANNPERAAAVKRASKMNRRAREVNNGGKVTGDEIANLFEKQRGRCGWCGKRSKLSVDHIRPIASGGPSDISNLQLLCMPCNRSKSDKDAIVWAQEHGRLL